MGGGITFNLSSLKLIPGQLFAYWISDKTINNFANKKLSDIMVTREGMATADNDRFLRYWNEVNKNKIFFHATDSINAIYTGCKWFPYNKGGAFRRWYGNNEYVVNWYLDGKEIKNNIDIKTGRVRSHNYNGEYAFLEGLTWSSLSSGIFSLRYVDKGFLFDSKGAKAFLNERENIYYVCGLLNSTISRHYLSFIAPTIDYKVGDIIQIPYVEIKDTTIINKLVVDNISKCKEDWDSFETSWDFKKHPLV